jgi:hypothetical protein
MPCCACDAAFIRNEIYVDAFPEAHNKVRISAGGGEFPEWSPDVGELFYVSPNLRLLPVSLKRVTDSTELSSPRELFALPMANDGYSQGSNRVGIKALQC